ncbi:hypothetical protein PYW08_009627 [Mythimna loreyi]|uniref:Uncharacterized protein n=1 Tax=Mythimna loreyi TaxID=667449 RepID=A0ACC2Q7M6_9NEOP|nr:hypothetical protein PYW08_009627 [Mythimna loreyi]
MTAHSSKKFKNIDVGATVLVEVPRVDRGPLDSKNVVGKVIEKKNELYKVGTSFGIINDWLPRNAVLSTPGDILNETLPETKLPLRKIFAMSSTFGGQGIKQCNCKKYSKGQCLSNKCNCKKANILCNSRCHKSLTCANK